MFQNFQNNLDSREEIYSLKSFSNRAQPSNAFRCAGMVEQ